ncbi:hypothetical protein ABIE45_000364 [Methylobacterium sp. OAE515]|uniref:hypothetical protein n=1 Tax=Methylobacterium sp. OAE515 TaxID=2817895 RepID=UPI00178A0BB5
MKQVKKADGDFVVDGTIGVVLINDGTTPVVINEFHYQLARAATASSEAKSCNGTGDFVSLQGYIKTPIVLKSGEAQVVSTFIESAENMSAVYYDSEKRTSLEKQRIYLCPTLMMGYYGPLSGYGLAKLDLVPFDMYASSDPGYVSNSRNREQDLIFRTIIDKRRYF